jgi:hypothetical protein
VAAALTVPLPLPGRIGHVTSVIGLFKNLTDCCRLKDLAEASSMHLAGGVDELKGGAMAVELLNKQLISRATLESAITEAVRKSAPECEHFIGVIVERESPTAQSESNWDVRGVRFGKSDRKKASKALSSVLERFRSTYSLSEGGVNAPVTGKR